MMMLSNKITVATLLLSTLGFTACGSSDEDEGPNEAGGAAGVVDVIGEGKQPTARAAGAGVAAGEDVTSYVVNKLFLGDTDWSGALSEDPNVWALFGYNLDKLVSTKMGLNHCQPATATAQADIKEDGPDGVDNSFGKNLLPVLSSLLQNASDEVNQSIEEGQFSLGLRMKGIGASGDVNDAWAGLYALGDRTDAGDWGVYQELLSDATKLDTTKVAFPHSYISGNTWVSGDQGDVTISVNIQGTSLNLKIGHAVLTVDLSADRGAGTHGIIAGVIETEAFLTELTGIASSLSEDFCDPNNGTLKTISDSIRDFSDIMKDGSNGDATKKCDGISVGLGFEVTKTDFSRILEKQDAGEDKCAAE